MEEFYFTEIKSGIAIFYSPICASTSALVEGCSKVYGNGKQIGVYTFHQTAGRGQGKNSWESEPGKNIAISFLLQPAESANLVLWNKAITLGVRKAIQNLTNLATKIKWPNDIYVHNKKIAGLLLESITAENSKKYFTAGIGINVNQTKWRGEFEATSIALENGQDYLLIDVIHEVIDNIAYYINELNINKTNIITEEFNNHLWKIDEFVTLTTPSNEKFSGFLKGVDALGRIAIESDGTILFYHHGQVRIEK